MSIYYVIGHRGTGKTTFFRRLADVFNDVERPILVIDLDEEIERRENLSVEEIFKKYGVKKFRKFEENTLLSLVQMYQDRTGPVFIILGAGYNGHLPEPAEVLWLRRPSDKSGRIFLDRPRILPEVSPFEESLELYRQRNYRFSQTADEVLIRSEGFLDPGEADRIFFHLQKARVGGGMTLLPRHFKRFSSWSTFVERRINWGVGFFEIRDDLLDENMIRLALQQLPSDRLLLSFRSRAETLLHRLELSSLNWDWPFEFGRCPLGNPTILSVHQRTDDFTNFLQGLRGLKNHVKLAVEIESWEELEEGHKWWRQDPENRSFLPMSPQGRWAWYRALFGHQMKIAFFREDEGSAPDQPTFTEWVKTRSTFKYFAAVLGDPVEQSWTPAEQADFFSQRNMPVVRISLRADEDVKDALRILADLGLMAAAVTSPLKTLIFQACDELTATAQEFASVNTIITRDKKWYGHNTDVEGFKSLISDEVRGTLCIWGGGGTRSVLERTLPTAVVYSARSGEAQNMRPDEKIKPRVVVWAVPRSRMAGSQWPPEKWKPEVVVDLNYTEDSPGREYALRTGARYVNGMKMFKMQASAQRKFWSPVLEAAHIKETL